ncbi:MAG: hypothetical protein ACK4G2_10205, partial [Novosphingobium sp.]
MTPPFALKRSDSSDKGARTAPLARTAPTPADLAITIRDRRFGRNEPAGRWWLNNDPVATAWHNALSATFP